jgi:hypothetical protein
MKPIDWNAVAALAAVAAAVVAIGGLIFERRRYRSTQAIDLLLRFEDRFATPELRHARAEATRGLRRNDPTQSDDVLDFFETVGLIVERHALDIELVWSSFDYWLRRYGILTARYVAESRDTDRSIWRNFVTLRDKVAEFDGRPPGDADTLDRAEIDDFLEYEESQDSARDDQVTLKSTT